MTFSDLKFGDGRNGIGGAQAIAFFQNGYGVSIIRNGYSYGGKDGLYELAVIRGSVSNWDIDYDTPITDDVRGWLSEDTVTDILTLVEALPS